MKTRRRSSEDNPPPVTAERLAFIVDAAAYFQAFTEAAEQARHQVFILAWDFDTRVHLRRGPDQPHSALADLLHRVGRSRPKLHVRVLLWEAAMIYSFEREKIADLLLDWPASDRIQIEFDSHHPPGTSLHEKVVVVDDRVAFLGGLDLTANRWDTPEHRPDDPRRTDWAGGSRYRPFHDVQAVVAGPAAAALGERARERWRRATGQQLGRPPAGAAGPDPWPPSVDPELESVELQIAYTQPRFAGERAIHDSRRLILGAIERARRDLFIENQYFTARVIARAVARRLRQPDGPEVLLVLPQVCSSWVEQTTMCALRARLLRRLRRADRHGRLHAYSPILADDHPLNVHSKVLIADDDWLYVGSANLSSRSMGADYEVGIVLKAAGRAEVRRTIAGLRERLLSEHLGCTPEEFRGRRGREAGLAATVNALTGGPRRLVRLEEEVPSWLEAVLPPDALIDPERPVRVLDIAHHLFSSGEDARPADRPSGGRKRVSWSAVLTILALIGLAAAWSFTPLGSLVSPQRIAGWVEPWRGHPAAGLIVVGIYLTASAVLLPVNLLIVAVGLIFGPLVGGIYSMAGLLASGVATFGLGRLLGRGLLVRLLGARLERLQRRVAARGLLPMVLVRLVPVAPYTIVNLAAGALQVGFRDFFLGTILGLLPGLTGLSLLTLALQSVMEGPSALKLAMLVALALALAGLAVGVRRLLSGRRRRSGARGTAGEEA